MNINSLLAQILCDGGSEARPQIHFFFPCAFPVCLYLSLILVLHAKSCNPFQTKPVFIVMQNLAQQCLGPW